MMRGELLCWDGRRIRLPDAVEWRFQYGYGTPCDSFQLTCLWEPDSGNDLAEAVSFTAEENGERLFTGVVDECERGWDGKGGFLTVSGRSMAARLLDNEALGMDYQVATWQDIVRDHISPYGIQVLGSELPAVPGFSVAVGSSEWQVVYEFCRYYGGITPRFDRLGRLVATPWEEGKRLVLEEDAAVTALSLRDQRYGALSQVLVRDKTTGAVQTVDNSDFLRRGGMCRRVLTMPGKSSYQAMRYSGSYQLERSAEELRQLELELPGAFLAWPGDLVEVRLARPVGRGIWRVAETVSGMDDSGTYTRLILGLPDALK